MDRTRIPRQVEKKKENLTPDDAIRRRMKNLSYREEITTFFTRLAVLVILLLILFGLIFGITPMKNDDMSPRISAGDLMLYYRLDRDFISDDVVVFTKNGEQYTGRIVAVGGDSVEITEDAQLVVNGGIVMDSDIFYTTPQYESDVTYPIQLAEDEYFILCDYREGARDSRYFGPVNASEIKGKVITVIRRSNL
mgnify:CR=1 FL=1